MDMDKVRIPLQSLLMSISNAQDLVSKKLSNHHQQVAYLSFQLAGRLALSDEEREDIFLGALVHDMGALSAKESLEVIEREPVTPHNHAFRGAKLFEDFKPLQRAAGIIKFHHLPWEYGKGLSFMGEDVPPSSHILHLADRVSAMIRPDKNILTQLPDILSAVREKERAVFRPQLVEALFDLRTREHIWLDLTSQSPAKKICEDGLSSVLTLGIDDISDLALIFSRIIDFRSPFTARHSAGVAKTSERLAKMMGFSPHECKMMLIAGYLHDLGKIAISDEILEKPMKLNEDEFNEMRAHTYYTYRLLEPLEQLKTINKWAAFHHEKLDGTGYPFHIEGDNLSLGSRIMAVADVFTAITEDRPYRKGMSPEAAGKVLYGMVSSGALDGTVVHILMDNFGEVNTIRKKAQTESAEQYKKFMKLK